MAEPFAPAAVHCTVAAWFPGVAATLTGAVGIPIVTTVDVVDCGPRPLAFLAVTLKPYFCPFVRPVTVSVVAAELKV